MTPGTWRCPTDPHHLCAQTTFDALGFCPYCHISPEARAIGLQRHLQRNRRSRKATA